MKHTDLVVWQKSIALVEAIYRISKLFPSDERFGLCTQIQRAAVSAPANIAEGQGRKSTGAYLNHLSIAHGSLMELETHVMIARRLGYISEETESDLLNSAGEVGRMLNGLQNSLNPES
jgi:four helix bundle protein